MKVRAVLNAAVGATLSLALLASAPARAELSVGTRAEIDHLVAYVGGAGCEFYRNGSWYEGMKGQSHITDKLNYLLGKDMIKATGDFIDKASMGLTMIWCNTLWYPATRLLLFKGARNEGAFKKDWTPFAEFKWADYFRALIPKELVKKDFDKALKKAVELARAPGASRLPGYIPPKKPPEPGKK